MDTFIVGVGMTPFQRPASGTGYVALAGAAIRDAIADSGLDYADMQQVYAGWAYGDTTSGQRALLDVGMSGVPVFNVNNACASGSSAVFLARQAVRGGAADCVLAFGFEQMPAGAMELFFADRDNVLSRHIAISDELLGDIDAPMTPKVFAAAGREHMEREDITVADYAAIAVKARRHAGANPRAIYREPISLDEVLNSRAIVSPLTKLQCCPPSSGAAAVIVCSADFVRRRGLSDRAVAIRGMGLTTDREDSFSGSAIAMVGTEISARAGRDAYSQAGVAPDDIDLVELHDCFTVNEALAYAALGLCAEGGAAKMIRDSENTYGGRVVVNPSGGLLSKGHPLGATGPAQLAELTWQLRGDAGARQVEGARLGLQHNVGLNGAAVVTVLEAA